MLNQICTWTAKTRAVPSLHRDNFLAKVSGLCPVLRQVTPTNFIAGPLGGIVWFPTNDQNKNLTLVHYFRNFDIQFNNKYLI
jgi:hypothetical protein